MLRTLSPQMIRLILIACLLTVTVGLSAQDNTVTLPEPASISSQGQSEIALYFETIKQGRVGLMRVTGDNIASIQANLLTTPVHFWQPDETDTDYFGFVVAPIDIAIRTLPLDVTISYADGTTEAQSVGIQIESGGFIQQNVILIEEEQLRLIDPEVEANEFSRIFSITENITASPLWDESGFEPPVNAPLTSPFGAVRVFNGTFNTLHTGWDFNVATGQPLAASAAGKVVFAGPLDIRGNYVLIDHGVGIYSGYAHLSVVYVTQGQTVTSGQIIGQVGSTGRSSSAHGHIEFIANNHWVDAADFIQMVIP